MNRLAEIEGSRRCTVVNGRRMHVGRGTRTRFGIVHRGLVVADIFPSREGDRIQWNDAGAGITSPEQLLVELWLEDLRERRSA